MQSIKAIRGTHDVLPAEAADWQYLEERLREIVSSFGYGEIRIPTFEASELYCRSVGDTTDVVQKEMYSFEDKGGRSITLRPEGTAGVVRSLIENSIYAAALPAKLYYLLSCFRYEKPQAGRLREFHQFGVEVFGAQDAAADVELISLPYVIFQKLGLSGIILKLNSIGCPACRAQYHSALKEYFSKYLDQLCPTCNQRFEKNPMRILDCKSEVCHGIAENAPIILDYLCDDCKAHFEKVRHGLDDLKIPYEIDPHIVRGLDYYTRTVFEFVTDCIGAQSTVCGGGRYDVLVESMGGPPTAGLGFAMGLERLLSAMESQGLKPATPRGPLLFLGTIGDRAAQTAAKLALTLRQSGLSVQYDLLGRSLKAQMKYADKLGARYSLVLGDDEVDSGNARLKDMGTGAVRDVALSELPDTLQGLDTL